MQSTIETSVCVAAFSAMNVEVDTLHAIQYKLRMMDIPLSGPTYIYIDNMLVIHNALKSELTLAYYIIHVSCNKEIINREHKIRR